LVVLQAGVVVTLAALAGVVVVVLRGAVVDVFVVVAAIDFWIAAKTSFSALPPQLVTCEPSQSTAQG
jgi:hypothetical protein